MRQRGSAGRFVLTMLGRVVSLLVVFGAAILLRANPASANYTAALNGTTLEVTGDSRSDDLALRLDATGTMLVVDVKNDGTADFTFDRKYGRRDYRGGGRSSARETVARVLSDLAKKQLVVKEGASLVIKDIDRLRDMVEQFRGD